MTEAELKIIWDAKIKRWRGDWCMFAKEVLCANLDEEQQEILTSVQNNKLTSVASGTARGKDFVAAVACLCFMYLTPRFKNGVLIENTKVAMTAPTDRQVKNIMMPEISRLWRTAKKIGSTLPGRLNAYDIRTNHEEWFLTGFKADEHNHEAWSGFHAVNTMFVVTEASGISDDTFAAIEGNLQGNSRMLIVFNPNTTVGYAAKSQRGNRWNKFSLSSLTAPNIIHKKTIIPGQVDYDWIKDKLDLWCVKIDKSDFKSELDDFEFEGQWYRPEDLFRVKVLGKFPKIDEDVLVPLQWIVAAQERWQLNYDVGKDKLILGVDVAGMGRDSSVYCYRWGNFVQKIQKVNSGGKADHMKIAGVVKHVLDSNKNSVASIDTIGEGAGVYSRLIEEGFEGRAISCKYSAKAEDLSDITEQHEFENMRAYLFWAVRDWLDPKNETGAMLPPGDGLAEEATEIKWWFKSNGKIIIEPKEDIKKRLGKSTDEFDALANTFFPIKNTTAQNLSGLFF